MGENRTRLCATCKRYLNRRDPHSHCSKCRGHLSCGSLDECDEYVLFTSPQKQSFRKYTQEEAAKPPKAGTKAALQIAQLQAELASLRGVSVPPVTDSQASAIVTAAPAEPMDVDPAEPAPSIAKRAEATGKGKGKGKYAGKTKQASKGSGVPVPVAVLVDYGQGSGPCRTPLKPRYQSSPRPAADPFPKARGGEANRTPQYLGGPDPHDTDVSAISHGSDREYGNQTENTVVGAELARMEDDCESPHPVPTPADPARSRDQGEGSGQPADASSHGKANRSRSARRKRQRERSESLAGADTQRVQHESEDEQMTPEPSGSGATLALPVDSSSTVKPLFEVVQKLLPGVVRVKNPQRQQVRSYADRILNTNPPAAAPFKTLPLSPEVAGNLATVWHGVMDTRLRQVHSPANTPKRGSTEKILCHIGGSDASLPRGAIPKTPKVGNKVYTLYPPGTLESAPALPVSLSRPKEVKTPQATHAALSEDWRVALRQVSFIDTITGAIARVASDTKNRDLLTLTSAIGSAVGDLSSTIAHGFATQLLVTRDSVLDANSGSLHLREDAARARVGPPLSSDLLPNAVASEKEARRSKDSKLRQDLFTAMQRTVAKATPAAKQPVAGPSKPRGKPTGEPTTSGRGRGGRGRGAAPRENRGRGSSFRGAARGANHPARGRGAAKGTD